MELLQNVIDFYNAHAVAIWGSLFAMSELLALIPAVQSNSIFQLIFNNLKKAAGK